MSCDCNDEDDTIFPRTAQVASNRALLASRNKGLAGERGLSVGGGAVESALRDQWEEMQAQRQVGISRDSSVAGYQNSV